MEGVIFGLSHELGLWNVVLGLLETPLCVAEMVQQEHWLCGGVRS